jgi:hypothetical protein
MAYLVIGLNFADEFDPDSGRCYACRLIQRCLFGSYAGSDESKEYTDKVFEALIESVEGEEGDTLREMINDYGLGTLKAVAVIHRNFLRGKEKPTDEDNLRTYRAVDALVDKAEYSDYSLDIPEWDSETEGIQIDELLAMMNAPRVD